MLPQHAPQQHRASAVLIEPSATRPLTYCGGGVVKGKASLSRPGPRLLMARARKLRGVSYGNAFANAKRNCGQGGRERGRFSVAWRAMHLCGFSATFRKCHIRTACGRGRKRSMSSKAHQATRNRSAGAFCLKKNCAVGVLALHCVGSDCCRATQQHVRSGGGTGVLMAQSWYLAHHSACTTVQP